MASKDNDSLVLGVLFGGIAATLSAVLISSFVSSIVCEKHCTKYEMVCVEHTIAEGCLCAYEYDVVNPARKKSKNADTD